MAAIARHLHRPGPDNPFPGVYALQRRLGRSIEHQLGSNEGLDMPHRALRERFGEAVANLARSYGDSEAYEVRRRLSTLHDVSMSALVVDAGADSLIALCLRALCDPGVAVIMSAGSYPTFRYFCDGQGCRRIEVPYLGGVRQLAPDLDALAAAAREHRARVVYLANPDNPSGHVHSEDAVEALRGALPPDCTLILDEAYYEFRPDEAGSDPLEGVIRLRTFSKACGMAGLRVGYAIAPPAVIETLYKVRIHYAVSSLALAAAETVLDHKAEVDQHVRAVIACRERLAEHLIARGGDVMPSATNFVAVRLANAEDAAEVQRALLAEGTVVHRPAHPAMSHVLRITAVADALAPGRLRALEQAL